MKRLASGFALLSIQRKLSKTFVEKKIEENSKQSKKLNLLNSTLQIITLFNSTSMMGMHTSKN